MSPVEPIYNTTTTQPFPSNKPEIMEDKKRAVDTARMVISLSSKNMDTLSGEMISEIDSIAQDFQMASRCHLI
jgi:hypothetical protein